MEVPSDIDAFIGDDDSTADENVIEPVLPRGRYQVPDFRRREVLGSTQHPCTVIVDKKNNHRVERVGTRHSSRANCFMMFPPPALGTRPDSYGVRHRVSG